MEYDWHLETTARHTDGAGGHGHSADEASRLLYEADPQVPVLPGAQFQVSWDTWRRQVTLTDTADAAIRLTRP